VSRARDVVDVIARALADKVAGVQTTEYDRRNQTVVELSMAPGELGRVIGRKGRTAQAIRSLASAAGDLEGLRVAVDFLDE
jgi:predicted RNA-binding protein YlqC (UPF0109 family)